ncbi:MAG: glucuronate isomerase, partial [Planctomycetes bacterium]|nr:glucuronate isomerase [Planctomycetota bacterium]
MSKPFINDSFLLASPAAERLFHDYARDMPILDYHSHLPIRQIVDDVNFDNITAVWLYGDHYKWRAMRTCGYRENLVSGIPDAAGDWERFAAWAATVPQTIGNPLYHWTHLELKRYFDVDDLLCPATAEKIYAICNEKLSRPEFSVRSLIKRANVRALCTTDDPVDSLADHMELAKEDWGVAVFPAWRPDKALAADDISLISAWLDRLETAADMNISTYRDLTDALWKRHQFFHQQGCRISDYGINQPYALRYSDGQVETAFAKLRSGTPLSGDELERYRSAVLHDLLVMDAEQDWTQQLHFDAKRNNNSKAFAQRGPDTGYDCMGEFPICDNLVSLLDRLETEGKLTRTIIYDLNPKNDDLLASIIGSFQDGSVPGKMQFGT